MSQFAFRQGEWAAVFEACGKRHEREMRVSGGGTFMNMRIYCALEVCDETNCF